MTSNKKQINLVELFRGGLLLVIRWLFHYPVLLYVYRVRNLRRAPFRAREDLFNRPGILVSNYGNYFFDNILGLMTAPVWPFAFVRDSFYRKKWLRPILWFFRCIPVARVDDPYFGPEARRDFNEKTFETVSSMLRAGNWFSVFPETSHGHRSNLLTPLKPGVAKVALKAEDSAGWNLDLHIYVYGTNYENKFIGRSYLYIRWATPIRVSKYRELFESDPVSAEASLMKEIEDTLRGCVLEAPTVEQLADSHRLAWQKKEANYNGVQRALREVLVGSAGPETRCGISLKWRDESLSYQLLGFILLGVGTVLGYPFMKIGKLCSRDPSQEMTYQFLLWLAVLVTGLLFSEHRWATFQFVSTWLVMNVWLWAWRRGIAPKS